MSSLFLRRKKFVEPIRDRKKIPQIKNLLRGQPRYRDLLLFVIGINTTLLISDLLQLRLSQLQDETGKIKRKFLIQERVRGKRHEIALNQSMKEALIEYLETYPFRIKANENYLWPGGRRIAVAQQKFDFILQLLYNLSALGWNSIGPASLPPIYFGGNCC